MLENLIWSDATAKLFSSAAKNSYFYESCRIFRDVLKRL